MSQQSTSRVSNRGPAPPRTSDSVTASQYSRTSGNSHQPSESGRSRRSGNTTTSASERGPPTRSRLSQSQRSGSNVVLPSERPTSNVSAPSQISRSEGTATRSRVSSARSGRSGSSTTRASDQSRSRGRPSHSRISSVQYRGSGRTIMLPSERAGSSTSRSMSQSNAPSGSRRSGSHISHQSSGITSVRTPPSTINTELLPSTLIGSQFSDARSGTRASSIFTSHPDTGIPNMQDWTVRAQLDHYITHCTGPEAEAEAEARGDPCFTALKRIAATMGCIDHQHHLELDTILHGGSPPAALERLKECHNRNRGHLYGTGCCGAGAYLGNVDEAVVVSLGGSRTGGNAGYSSSRYSGSQASSRYSSNHGGSRASSHRDGSRLSGRAANSGSRGGPLPPSSWRGGSQSASRIPTSSSTGRSSSHGGSRASGSVGSTAIAPSSVWRGGNPESVLPSESASQI